MRLLLDAHVPSAHIGKALERNGHDVRALDREPEQESLVDDGVLRLATVDSRILVTHDVTDFPEILRDWAEAGRAHAGVILVHGIDQNEFGTAVRGVERLLAARPRQTDWIDLAAVLSRTESR